MIVRTRPHDIGRSLWRPPVRTIVDRWLDFLKKFFLRSSFLDESLFDDLDLRKFLERSLTLGLEQSGADQMIWINQSEFEKIKNHNGSEKFEAAQSYAMDLKICGSKEVVVDELVQKLKEYNLDKTMVQVKETELLMPVNSHEGKSILGYWLATGIPRG